MRLPPSQLLSATHGPEHPRAPQPSPSDTFSHLELFGQVFGPILTCLSAPLPFHLSLSLKRRVIQCSTSYCDVNTNTAVATHIVIVYTTCCLAQHSTRSNSKILPDCVISYWFCVRVTAQRRCRGGVVVLGNRSFPYLRHADRCRRTWNLHRINYSFIRRYRATVGLSRKAVRTNSSCA